MADNKNERDAARNAGLGEIFVQTGSQPWLNFSPGIDFKVLRTSQETGAWSVLFKCAAGSSFARHEHLAAGEYLMISGTMELRGGEDHGGVTARPGDYGYEANGSIHDDTNFPEECILYFTNFGPIRFINDNDETVFVLDYRALLAAEASAKAKLAA
jgi:anti-sigma factor ChrR (cupin superfamily)